MPRLELATGTGVLIGKPARALPRHRVQKISTALAGFEQVREAHLPEVFALGAMRIPAVVLYVVVEPESACAEVAARLGQVLEDVLPRRQRLDVWPVGRQHELLDTVRATGCVVGWRDD